MSASDTALSANIQNLEVQDSSAFNTPTSGTPIPTTSVNIWSSPFYIGWGIYQTQIPQIGAEAKNYITFGHSLHSTQQALICLYEAYAPLMAPLTHVPFFSLSFY